MLHDVCLRRLCSSHLKNAGQLGLGSFPFLNKVHVCLLNELSWIAEHFDTTLHLGDRFGHVVKISVRGFRARRLAADLQTRQEKQRVLKLFEIELELMGTGVAHFFDLEKLSQELVSHSTDNFVEEQVLID